jgi:hypothetical protein
MKRVIAPRNAIPPKQEVTPYPEVTERPPLVKWEAEAIESLQSLERYSVLKAIEEGKRLVKKVMEVAAKDAGPDQVVMKFHVQNAIAQVLDELESSRRQESHTPSEASEEGS